MRRSSERDEVRCEASVEGPVMAVTAKRKKVPSARNCREFIRKETAEAMPNIVSTFVGEARNGSVAHFNALAKVGAFDQRKATADGSPKRRKKSFARQLLDEVEKYEARQASGLAAAAREETSRMDHREMIDSGVREPS